jgi:hypothetical protein
MDLTHYLPGATTEAQFTWQLSLAFQKSYLSNSTQLNAINKKRDYKAYSMKVKGKTP